MGNEDQLAARNFSHAASKAGIKRIIYLGGLGRDEKRLSDHLQSRHDVVGNILRCTDVQVIEFRASVIIGSGSLDRFCPFGTDLDVYAVSPSSAA